MRDSEYIKYDGFTLAREEGNNEDSIIVKLANNVLYAAIADGVGGQIGGEIASKYAVNKLDSMMKVDCDTSISDIYDSIQTGLSKLADENVSLSNMATTMTTCVICSNDIAIGHVGDSRLYLIRNNEIIFKTTDHNLYSSLSNADDKYPKSVNLKKYLTSALSPKHGFKLESTILKLSKFDRIFICSDGVHTVVDDSELLMLSEKSHNCQSLLLKIKAVLRIRGLEDDSSAICIDYIGS